MTSTELQSYIEEVKKRLASMEAELALLEVKLAQEENIEPYAWTTTCGNYLEWRKGALEELSFKDADILPIYLAPPKREWVGLSDAEQTKIVNDPVSWQGLCNPVRIARMIEEKLKELNK